LDSKSLHQTCLNLIGLRLTFTTSYAPQIFQTIGLSKADSSMFATGIYGTVKVVATAIFLYVGIDRFGRKKSLIAGGFWMAAMMFIIGAVLATHPPVPGASGVSQASTAMVAMR
jgi:hypothetical protein